MSSVCQRLKDRFFSHYEFHVPKSVIHTECRLEKREIRGLILCRIEFFVTKIQCPQGLTFTICGHTVASPQAAEVWETQ